MDQDTYEGSILDALGEDNSMGQNLGVQYLHSSFTGGQYGCLLPDCYTWYFLFLYVQPKFLWTRGKLTWIGLILLLLVCSNEVKWIYGRQVFGVVYACKFVSDYFFWVFLLYLHMHGTFHPTGWRSHEMKKSTKSIDQWRKFSRKRVHPSVDPIKNTTGRGEEWQRKHYHIPLLMLGINPATKLQRKQCLKVWNTSSSCNPAWLLRAIESECM